MPPAPAPASRVPSIGRPEPRRAQREAEQEPADHSHLPAFLLSGLPQSAWEFAPFFIGSVAVSVILTSIFNAYGGSILLAALFHFQLNNPIWPDAQPWDSVLFVVAAVVVVVLNRRTLFDRNAGVTRILMPGDQSETPEPDRPGRLALN